MRELLPVLFAGLVPIAVLALIVTGTAFSLVAWQPPIFQTTQFGTPNSENGITAIVGDPTGIYVAGFVGHSFYGDYNVTPAYLFVNRYTLDASLVWSRHFDNPYLSYIYAITTEPSGVLVASQSNGSSLVRAFDLNGNELWINQFVSVGAGATTVVTGPTGVYVGGFNGSTYFLSGYGFDGSLVWTEKVGNYVSKISAYFSEGIYVLFPETAPGVTLTGSSLLQKYDPNGTLLWSRTCICDSSGITGDKSGIYAVGSVQTAGGASDGFLGKYDFNGNELWATSFSAPGYNGLGELASSADSSGLYLTATTSDNRAIVMSYDASGGRLWSIRLPWRTAHDTVPGNAIAVEGATVYLGGEMAAYPLLAFLTLMSKSSSLVFLGINPPVSFGLLGALLATSVISLMFLRRLLKNRPRHATTGRVYRSQRDSTR